MGVWQAKLPAWAMVSWGRHWPHSAQARVPGVTGSPAHLPEGTITVAILIPRVRLVVQYSVTVCQVHTLFEVLSGPRPQEAQSLMEKISAEQINH